MLDRKKMEEIPVKAKRDQWPYPKIFEALKEAGVESYETKVSTHEITYYGGSDTWTEPVPPGFQPLAVSPTFDQDGVQAALRRTQKKETDYPQFLKEIAAAGVASYRVDMAARTVTYRGRGGESYAEEVPPV